MDESVVESRLDVANTDAVFFILAGSKLRWSVVSDLFFFNFTSFGYLLL